MKTGITTYECLEAIDVELFNRDMNALLKRRAGGTAHGLISSLGKREYKGEFPCSWANRTIFW